MTKRLPRTMHGKDLTGEQFGLLVALHPTAKTSRAKYRIWVCECKCGKRIEVSTRDLREKTLHCGCGYDKKSTETVNREIIEFNNHWLSRPLIGGEACPH